jgi:hypothetical protein
MPTPIKGGTHKTAINTPNASNTTKNTNKSGNATRRNNNSYIFLGFSIFILIKQSPFSPLQVAMRVVTREYL